MKKVLLFSVILSPLFWGCVTLRGFEEITTKHYESFYVGGPVVPPNDIVFVEKDTLPEKAAYCECQRKKYFLLPLVVVNYLERKIDCSINKKIFEDRLLEEINDQLTRYNAAKSDGSVIVSLSIRHVPTLYNAHFTGFCIFLPFPPFIIGLRGGNQQLGNPAEPLTVAYKIYSRETNETARVVRRGILTEVCPALTQKRDREVSRKQFVKDYLDSWDVSMRQMSRRVATQLVNVIDREEVRQE